VPLTELLIEIDRESGFSAHLTHAGGASPRHPELEHRRNLYAAVLSLACNFGSTRMSELTGIPADTIDWTVQWYLREETLRPANTAIVNAHHRHPLTAALGGGTLSSSDGLRMPMRGKSLTGRALSRYFVHEGLTSYTHISDQYSTYGTQVVVSTERDATFTLDEILGNTTELPIAEHTTDSHGQTLATFALFDLVGLRLSPRIARLTEKQLWRPHPASHYKRWPRAGPLLEHHVQVDLIAEHWDDLLRIGGSLKRGHVSAALLIAKLQAGSRQHPLAKALLEYGKLLRTLHALRCSPTRPSAGVSAVSSTGARPPTISAGSSFSPIAVRSATPTTTTRPPRRIATRSSSTPASCPPPATSKTPSTPKRPTATRSAKKPRPT
jgi:TnpA family transposase